MTKLRAPLSIEQALLRIAGVLDWPTMATIAKRTVATVRAWADPDKPESPTLPVAAALDAGYRRAGGAGAPLHEAYGHLVEAASRDAYPNADRLTALTIRCIKEGGEANAALVRACQPDATDRERAEAAREVAESMAELQQTLPLLTQGAGPGVSSDGEGNRDR